MLFLCHATMTARIGEMYKAVKEQVAGLLCNSNT